MLYCPSDKLGALTITSIFVASHWLSTTTCKSIFSGIAFIVNEETIQGKFIPAGCCISTVYEPTFSDPCNSDSSIVKEPSPLLKTIGSVVILDEFNKGSVNV